MTDTPDHDPFLHTLGWDAPLAVALADFAAPHLSPARVMGQGRGHYQIQATADGTFEAAISTKFHDQIADPTGFPTVGDWVAFELRDGTTQATIHAVLARRNLIRRTKAGAGQEVQLIAANADVVLAVTSLEGELDLERLANFVALGRAAQCPTAVVLTKADLCSDVDARVRAVRATLGEITVHVISARDAATLTALDPYFAAGRTAVLVGPSGAGKSTLTNHLLGFAAQKTQGVSGNAKGRHTTTARTLRITRFGGLVMDTPGMQEVLVEAGAEGAGDDFADVEELTLRCKFTDCGHGAEPGCAVTVAIKAHELTPERWASYLAARAKAARREKSGRGRHKKYSRVK